ncbi:glyoxalase [Hyaloscypha finlandica]|nr:glyoxalase [Hyaloscypha sp. PMI_1271]KAH8753416.1 glyoxalase [Hyaloscypha finlandica]
MLGHVGIRVPDLEAATEFYDKLLSTLSYTTKTYPTMTVVGPSDNSTPIPCFMLRKYTPSNANGNAVRPSPVHISFYAKTRKQVDEFHAAGIKAGGNDNGGPGLRTFMANYYAAFVLDPDGNNVEAVCFAEE